MTAAGIPAESVPLTPPANLQSKVLSTTTVWLQWIDPSIGSGQSAHDARYYNVHYQAIQPFGKALSAVARDLHVILYNLAPATRYEFKVRTVKGIQTSHYSATVTNRTFETGDTRPLLLLPRARYIGDGVLFSIDFFVYIFVYLFIYIFVSLLARLRENGWTDLHEIFREGVE